MRIILKPEELEALGPFAAEVKKLLVESHLIESDDDRPLSEVLAYASVKYPKMVRFEGRNADDPYSGNVVITIPADQAIDMAHAITSTVSSMSTTLSSILALIRNMVFMVTMGTGKMEKLIGEVKAKSI